MIAIASLLIATQIEEEDILTMTNWEWTADFFCTTSEVLGNADYIFNL